MRFAIVSAGLLALGASVSPESFSAPGDAPLAADVLAQLWPGVRDSNEQAVVTPERGPASFSDRDEQRVRTVVARVQVPWLGLRILYLEEFLHDEPSTLRRQLLLRIEPDMHDEHRVRVYPYTFKDAERWRQLNRSPRLLATLQAGDL
ncbi:MAG TPA: CpcT/CpeT family chromophore lyase, partial [Steroidobacteraceae bacterium]|nr:CpcT/CpeT family chromophore lyase [Steroidobacteraceae bacterium]